MTNPVEEIREILGRLNFYEVCPDCKGKCCNMPWMPDEECSLIKLFEDGVEKLEKTNFFLNRTKCKFLDKEGNCTIYDLRPMDCRLYPLDIIEENGRYYWCLFTDCPGWRSMKDLLEPEIPRLEAKITQPLWNQFKSQIKTSKVVYEPYKNGRYILVKSFEKFS